MNLEETRKKVIEYIDNLSDEEVAKLFANATEQYEKSWLPETQSSLHPCWSCGEDGHAVFCKDGIGRNFCPNCRQRAEKEFMRSHI